MGFDAEQVKIYLNQQSLGLMVDLDIVKAVCLGAKAVGLGRSFLYAQSVIGFPFFFPFLLKILAQAYGVDGVSKMIQILKREIITAMRLAGASNVHDLRPEMVAICSTHVANFTDRKEYRSIESTGNSCRVLSYKFNTGGYSAAFILLAQFQ